MRFASVGPGNQPLAAPAAGAHQGRFRRQLEIHLLALKGAAGIHPDERGGRAGGAGTSSLLGQRAGAARGIRRPRGPGALEPRGPGAWPGAGDEPSPGLLRPPPSLPFQRHYKSNGLERKASKILKPSSIINADSKFPLRAFYLATVTKSGWWGCSSGGHIPRLWAGWRPPPSLDPAGLPPGHLPDPPRAWVGGSPAGRGDSWRPAERGSRLLVGSLLEAPARPAPAQALRGRWPWAAVGSGPLLPAALVREPREPGDRKRPRKLGSVVQVLFTDSPTCQLDALCLFVCRQDLGTREEKQRQEAPSPSRGRSGRRQARGALIAF